MMMPNDAQNDSDLDRLLDKARRTPPPVDDAFLARVLADAMAAQPRPAMAQGRVPRRSLWSRVAAALGGAAVLAGLGSAAMAGLVIGYVQPAPVLSLASGFGLGPSESLELLSGFDQLLTEDLQQ